VRRCKLSEGTRHTTLTLGEHLSERALRARSRHRDAKNLDHYARPMPDAARVAALLAPLEPNSAAESVTTPSLRDAEIEADENATTEAEQEQHLAALPSAMAGGADGTRTRNFRRDRPVL
jgi:hypothetical protein